jgi:hypothetical protein
MEKGRTYYSEEITGDRRNYHWPVRFDTTDGFLRITQSDEGRVKDCVLLSPKQVQAMIEFVRSHSRSKAA